MNKLFILAGASGAGKSTLLNWSVKEGYCNAAVKYSERKIFNTVDDISTVEDINDSQLQCDIIYSMYGNRYGFSSQKIRDQLKEGNAILVTNDKRTIQELKIIFLQQVVVIYVVSDINKSLLRQIYIKRHGLPSIENEKGSLLEKIRNAEKMILQDDWESFIQYVEIINDKIDDIFLQEEEFRLRLDSIKYQENFLSSDLFKYDYLIFNLYSNGMQSKHVMGSAFEQLEKIINREMEDKNG